MFFWVSKILDALVEPLTWWLLASGCAALAHRRGASTWARRWLVVAFMALLLPSLPFVSRALEVSLESDVVNTETEAKYDAVVLLGGVVDYGGTSTTQNAFNDNVERLLAVFELLRAERARVAILSGGAANRPEGEAAVLGRQLETWGIAPERLIVESQSLNTHQNAENVAALVRARGLKRLLLVTSAYHVPRAVGCLRREGLDVDVHPVDFRAQQGGSVGLWPRTAAMAKSAGALREYFGRFVYRVLGYSSAVERA